MKPLTYVCSPFPMCGRLLHLCVAMSGADHCMLTLRHVCVFQCHSPHWCNIETAPGSVDGPGSPSTAPSVRKQTKKTLIIVDHKSCLVQSFFSQKKHSFIPPTSAHFPVKQILLRNKSREIHGKLLVDPSPDPNPPCSWPKAHLVWMRAVSQGLSFRMKDLQLTWLHSCLLGPRWHDYRAELVPPTSSSMDRHAFQGDRMSRRWEGWPQLLLFLFFCWCCCFPQVLPVDVRDAYCPLLLRNTQGCISGSLQNYEFKLQMLHLP